MCSLTLSCVCGKQQRFSGRQTFLKDRTRRHSWTNMISRADQCNCIGTFFQATQRSKSREKFRHPLRSAEPCDFRGRTRKYSSAIAKRNTCIKSAEGDVMHMMRNIRVAIEMIKEVRSTTHDETRSDINRCSSHARCLTINWTTTAEVLELRC